MIHVDQLHVTTDGALDEAQARAWGTRLVHEVNATLQARRTPPPDVRVGELRLTVPRAALDGDDAAIRRYAASVAQRILEQAPE
jgi:hypothetical protein